MLHGEVAFYKTEVMVRLAKALHLLRSTDLFARRQGHRKGEREEEEVWRFGAGLVCLWRWWLVDGHKHMVVAYMDNSTLIHTHMCEIEYVC